MCTLVSLHSLLPFTDSDATATTAIVTSAAMSTPASGKCLHKAFRNVVIGICLFTMGMTAVYFHSPFEKFTGFCKYNLIYSVFHFIDLNAYTSGFDNPFPHTLDHPQYWFSFF